MERTIRIVSQEDPGQDRKDWLSRPAAERIAAVEMLRRTCYAVAGLDPVPGLTAEEVWAGREKGPFEDQEVFYLGRAALLKNKRSTGRTQDQADVESLGG